MKIEETNELKIKALTDGTITKSKSIISYSSIEQVTEFINVLTSIEEWEVIKEYIDNNISEITTINKEYLKRCSKTKRDLLNW